MKLSSKNSGLVWLKKWIRGDVTWKQERTLDEMAANDPFLADALEGFRTVTEGEHQQKVAVLQQQIQQQYEQKEARTSVFYWQRMAAMIAFIILAIGGLWYVNNGLTEAEAIAHQNTTAKEKPLPPEKMQSTRPTLDNSTTTENTLEKEKRQTIKEKQSESSTFLKNNKIPPTKKENKEIADQYVELSKPKIIPPKVNEPTLAKVENQAPTQTEPIAIETLLLLKT